MNNLVKNNPTAIKVIKMHKIKQQRNDIIKSLSFICLFILICYITGISMKTETISAIPINHQLNNKIATIITDNVKENKTVNKKVIDYKIQSAHISENGMNFIKKHEKFSAKGYWDVNGVTVGWGHKINKDDPEWLRVKKVGDWISKSAADKLFEKDMDDFINPALVRVVKELSKNNVHINQNMIDGIASLIYNCGEYGFKTTEFYRLLKNGKINKAIECVPQTRVYCEGHKERRKNEQKLMIGDYVC